MEVDETTSSGQDAWYSTGSLKRGPVQDGGRRKIHNTRRQIWRGHIARVAMRRADVTTHAMQDTLAGGQADEMLRDTHARTPWICHFQGTNVLDSASQEDGHCSMAGNRAKKCQTRDAPRDAAWHPC